MVINMEEEQVDYIDDSPPSAEEEFKSKLILYTAIALLIGCMFFLGIEYQKYNNTETLYKIYLEERCPNTVDYTVGCFDPRQSIQGVEYNNRYSLLDKELSKNCKKGYIICKEK